MRRRWRGLTLALTLLGASGAALILSGCAGGPSTYRSPDVPAQAGVTVAEDGSWQSEDFDWLDEARDRAVPVRVYRPAGAAPSGGWPVIVFSHGLGGSRRGYSYLGSYWASQGFVALHVQHVGSDRRLWSDPSSSSRLSLLLRLRQAAQPQEAIARALDVRYALDRLLQGPMGTSLDAKRLVIAGHSYGANTSLLLAGARLSDPQRFGDDTLLPSLHDARFKAAILISAPPFYGEGDPTPIVGGIELPTLHISATLDEINIPGYWSDTADRVRLYDAIGGADKVIAIFDGGSHSIFTDRLNTGGAELNPRVKAATRELSVAWLHGVLDPAARAELGAWHDRHGALLARWTAPDAAAAASPRRDAATRKD